MGATYEAVGGLLADPPDVPFSPGDYLDGFGWADYQIAHIVVRGTYVPGTIRCTSGNRFLVPSHLREGSTLGDSLHIECYANVRVNAYVVGTGPAVLTVTVASQFYGEDGQPHPHLDSDDIEELRRNYELALTRGGKYGRSDLAVSGPLGGITGREALLFLGPSANASVEAWEVHTTWDVYKKADGSVVVIHPDAIVYARLIRDDAAWENLQATLLPALSATEQATTEAHNARVAANGGRVRSGQQFPMLVTDANRLSSYFREVGAYDDLANPPAQPPPSPVTLCQDGGAVPRPNDNLNLLLDCAALLRAKDDLRGTAPLNWSHTTSITTWNGVTVDRDQDNSLFVRDLALADRGLNGFIPSALADLTGLRRLDLDDNALSGPLPPLLSGLTSLQQVYVSGNSLAGPLPPQWAALPNLRFLFLNGNDLSGALPPEWGGMGSLEQLVLDGNGLSGEIPSEWGGMAALEDLFLRDNALSGSIPRELDNLGSLEDLYLEGNAFTGCIPAGLRDTAEHDLATLGLPYCAAVG